MSMLPARGKGIASQLLQRLIAEAKAKGYRTLVAGIDASNEASIKLHQNSISSMPAH